MLYRLIVDLAQPYPVMLFSLLACLVWAWRTLEGQRHSLMAAFFAWSMLYLASTPLVGHLALGSLEWQVPEASTVPTSADTIVVLSGSLLVDDKDGTKYRIGPDTFYRCQHAIELYRAAGGCRILVSGGKVNWSQPGPTLAAAMSEFLLQRGVLESDLVVEDKSSTTFENALYSKAQLVNRETGNIYLVTHRVHMYRAERCFRGQRLTMVPAPCNPAVSAWPSLVDYLPSPGGLAAVNEAAHEWLGVAWYGLRGRFG